MFASDIIVKRDAAPATSYHEIVIIKKRKGKVIVANLIESGRVYY